MAKDLLLTPEEAAKRLNNTPRTLSRWRRQGAGPPFVRCGPRRIGYPESGLTKWCDARTFTSRAEELSAAVTREREAAHA